MMAKAAQSFESCTGFIDSLPATISTQGVWCLRKDLSTAITGAAAIQINANNVTIDCNHFKLGGLSAGAGADASGIAATNKHNITVRHCHVRGFYSGVFLSGGGHVVENNRFDRNTSAGVDVSGDRSVVRHNLILDTGGSSLFEGEATGIRTMGEVDVLDNTVSGVSPINSNSDFSWSYATGIYAAHNTSGSINNNRVRGLRLPGMGAMFGIAIVQGSRVAVRNNDISGLGSGTGIDCSDDTSIAVANVINGFTVPIAVCADNENFSNP
ncbi:right-handed parallel beta-helix repeat-containing protein [Marilutibacter alkalisoli]|nr:right-handed parallel beta-helix repeat-containing protein [Lysobacter alkalisoli]